MKEFRPYIKLLTDLTLTPKSDRLAVKSNITNALNGQANIFLRKNVNIETLRKNGIFFTGHKLASALAVPFSQKLSKGATVLDPACGAGDLLLAAAKRLPLGDSLKTTLSRWGSQLYGYDIDPEFIKAAKIRLFLLAQLRHKETQSHCQSLESLFPNIQKADFLKQSLKGKSFDLVLMNPPYHRIQIDNIWANGLTTAAAMFVYKCVTELSTGTKLGAILPDVLRTGTRYAKWRKEIEKATAMHRSTIIGRFDATTDVDVFQLELLIGSTEKTRTSWYQTKGKASRLSEFFRVKTGSVVPFRDKQEGKSHPFIDPSVVPAWKSVTPGKKTRRFNKKSIFTPPFVVIRRTSGPSDKTRAVASLIIGKKDVAVENHFIVLQPLSGGVRLCRNALKVLAENRTTTWLNHRIRCRHLTVDAIKNIPYPTTP